MTEEKLEVIKQGLVDNNILVQSNIDNIYKRRQISCLILKSYHKMVMILNY
ncbi:hypothetical protein DSECCO2_462000 [anaerobic digester metagenome]